MPASESTLMAIVNEDGSAAVVAGDVLTEFETTTVEDGRHAIMMHAIAAAQEHGDAVHLHVTEPDGAWPLIVHPDGNVEPDEASPAGDDADEHTQDGAPGEKDQPTPDAPGTAEAGGARQDGDAEVSADVAAATGAEPDAEPDSRSGSPDDARPAAPSDPRPDEARPAVDGAEDPSAEESLSTNPVRIPDPLIPGLVTTSLSVVDVGYDDEDDDSDVVDDPGPEPATRRRQRDAADPRPVGAPPLPKPASSTPKATTAVDPVAPAPAPATRAPKPDAIKPPTPLRTAAPAADASTPSAPPAASSPDPDAMDVFAPLHLSPQTPETRAGQERPTKSRRTEAATHPRAEQKAAAKRGDQPTRGRREAQAPDGRRSFLTPERVEEPAERGWRGFLARAGMRVPPSADERAERADMATVSQHWPGPRTIAIVNGKGGSGKTPTTIMTAAVFARYGGAGVLAWDNNQTRGTLGWRTEQGPHDASLHDLLPQTDRLLSAQAQSADLAHFVHHQTRDRYDVLRSRPMLLADEQRIEKEDVDRIHAVAAKYYRLIIMDSGNDESDPMWRRMIDLADQLVLTTTTRAEHAEAGALLLEALAERDERSARLVENSVAIVNQADPHAPASEIRGVVEGYRDLSREVAAIPYDPAMAGGILHFNALRPNTQRAWLAATAAVARGLGPRHP